jgi:tetratricopeptide (TPR) repeat protein
MQKLSIIWIFLNLPVLYIGAQDPYLEGIARQNEENHLVAREMFYRALETDKKSPDLYLHLAETYYDNGEFSKTMEILSGAEKLLDGAGDYLIAQSAARSCDADLAVIYLESHLKSAYKLPRPKILLDPAFAMIENSVPWRELWKRNWYTDKEEIEFEISYLSKSGNYTEALNIIRTELTDQPRWDELLAEKGYILFLLNNYKDAVRAYSQAIEISPRKSNYYLGRAKVYVESDQSTKAIQDMERVLREKPEMLILLKEIGMLYSSAGNYRQATNYIQQYLLYYPQSSEGHFLDGSVHYEGGQYMKALISFNQCLELDTSRAEYFIGRANTFLNMDTWTYAIKDYSMALDLDPFNPVTWYSMGLCYLRSGDREGAKTIFETAARYGSFEAAELLNEVYR